jgi:hypothetical protein
MAQLISEMEKIVDSIQLQPNELSYVSNLTHVMKVFNPTILDNIEK